MRTPIAGACLPSIYIIANDGGYLPVFALAAAIFAHLALTAARMFALPAALIFRFLLGAGADGVAGAGAAALPLSFAHRAF